MSNVQHARCVDALSRFGSQLGWHNPRLSMGCVVLECKDTGDRAPEEIAKALREAMGDAHESAILTYVDRSGARLVLRWDANEGTIESSPFPEAADSIHITAFWVSKSGEATVAITCGERDQREVELLLEGSDDNESIEDASHGLEKLSLADVKFPLEDGKPEMRRRVDGQHEMVHMTLVLEKRLPDGGFVAVIEGSVSSWAEEDTELQLTCGPLIVDRYALSANEIKAIKEEAEEISDTAQEGL